jgi:undecaprenyl phosphate N,N'-diacetylbacillosamine 1-phosphate transferase
MYKDFFKPLIDRLVALVMIVILLPFLIFISVLIITLNKTSPFFIQERPGLNEKIFNLIKFKTMSDNKDSNDCLLEDYKRITKLGSILRKSSIDELPELINILRGEMSFVGPRPLLSEYIPKYTEEQRLRHIVKPGITGLAQINGRNLLSWEEKFNLDVHYVKNVSFLGDLKIILKTIFVLFKAKDINQSDKITMEKFEGTSPINNKK